MVVKDPISWDKKMSKLKGKYKGKILFRVDTWKKYDWLVLENEDEVYDLNKNSDISGIFGVIE